jgi:hypothetical protein
MRPKCKIDDYVRVKDNTIILGKTEFFAKDWQGRVLKFNEEYETILLKLDAQTLDVLPDSYIKESIEDDTEFEHYFFGYDEIEPLPVPRRDTDQMLKAAMKTALTKYYSFVDEERSGDNELIELLARWIETPHFNTLPEAVQDITFFGIRTFSDYAFHYKNEFFEAWDASTVSFVCTYPIPLKVGELTEDIGYIGDALSAFFDWLDLNQLHPEAKAMRDEMQRVKPIMLKISADQGNLKLADQNHLYKNLNNNTMITVRYENGKQKTDKFKRLETDLLSGKCKLVSR